MRGNMVFLRFTGQPRFLEMEFNSSTIDKSDSSLRKRGHNLGVAIHIGPSLIGPISWYGERA